MNEANSSYISVDGRCGTAHQCVLDGKATAIAAWLIHVPNFHPAWSYWMLSCASLRDVEGFPPAKLHYPGAEFELILAALDPHVEPDPTDSRTWNWLRPLNYVRQFHGVGEEDAKKLTQGLVARCVHGNLLLELQGFVGAREAWDQAVTSSVDLLIAIKQDEQEANDG